MSSTAFILLCIIATIIAFVLWLLFGRDETPVVGVCFYPPKDMSCLEISYWYKGTIEYNNAIAVLFELENKGYLKIETKENNSFIIHHLKPYDGNKTEERTMYNEIFKFGKSVSKEELAPHFDFIKQQTATSIRKGKNPKQAYTASSLYSRTFILAEIVALIYCFFAYSSISASLKLAVIFLVMIFTVGWSFIVMSRNERKKLNEQSISAFNVSNEAVNRYKAKHTKNYIRFIIPTVSFFLQFGLIIASSFTNNPNLASAENILQIAAFVISFFTLTKLFRYVKKRTPESTRKYEEIMSFRNFLLSTESEQFNTLIKENPDYLKEMRPYIYVLGVSKEWSEKITNIDFDIPEWYSEMLQIESSLKNNSKPNFSNRFGGRVYK